MPPRGRNMIIYRSRENLHGKISDAVVTVGNFDGVHLGHREIFRRVRSAAAELGGNSVVVTFVPHPLKILAPERDFRLITTYAEKERLIGESGIDYLVTLPFSREFAAVSAERFVREILAGDISMKRLIIGYDYAFGRNREGDVHLLRRLGEKLGFNVDMLDQIGDGETGFSSSIIRERIALGDMRGVAQLLGRHFSVGGVVVHGFHRGRGIGFPTANIRVEEELLPLPGVYAVKVEGDGWFRDGACNVGDNPTFHASKVTVEAHILDFDGDLYGKMLRVHFIDRIRDETEFADVHALTEAIRRDVARCREVLRDAVPAIRYDG
jgi:riboflavin kinase / FMN adenylyltransferase